MTYAGFKIPNEADAGAHASQAGLDSLEVQAIMGGFAETVVLGGCAVTAQGSPDMTVAVAAGTIMVAGVLAQVASGNVTVTTADASNPRIDLIVVNSSGTKSCIAGTPAAAADSTHAGPVWPSTFDVTTYVVLAEVYVPAAATTITTARITDKRAMWTRYGHGCRLYHNATQNISDSTLTALAFNSELFDTDGLHDTVTNNSRITIPTGLDGLWHVGGNLEMPADGAAATGASVNRLLTLRLNGNHYLAESRPGVRSTGSPYFTAITGYNVSSLWKASAGDYFELAAYHDDGHTMTIAARTSTQDDYLGFWAYYVGK